MCLVVSVSVFITLPIKETTKYAMTIMSPMQIGAIVTVIMESILSNFSNQHTIPSEGRISKLIIAKPARMFWKFRGKLMTHVKEIFRIKIKFFVQHRTVETGRAKKFSQGIRVAAQ